MKEKTKFSKSEFMKDMNKIMDDYHTREAKAAKKDGFAKAYNPDGWLPKDPNVAVRYLDSLKLKTFVCPVCKKPLILRYEYLIVQRNPQKEAFTPTFICNHPHGDKSHAHHYQMKNGKLTPFE
jgi:uncharacterized protein YbaR (Trm112 family)